MVALCIKGFFFVVQARELIFISVSEIKNYDYCQDLLVLHTIIKMVIDVHKVLCVKIFNLFIPNIHYIYIYTHLTCTYF